MIMTRLGSGLTGVGGDEAGINFWGLLLWNRDQCPTVLISIQVPCKDFQPVHPCLGRGGNMFSGEFKPMLGFVQHCCDLG